MARAAVPLRDTISLVVAILVFAALCSTMLSEKSPVQQQQRGVEASVVERTVAALVGAERAAYAAEKRVNNIINMYRARERTPAAALRVRPPSTTRQPRPTPRGYYPVSVDDALNTCKHNKKQHRCAKATLRSAPAWDGPTPAHLATLAALRGRRLLVLGDSLAWELATALRCYALEGVFDVTYHNLHVFPVREDDFEQMLNTFFAPEPGEPSRYDAVVMAVGAWYNWEFDALAPGTAAAAARRREATAESSNAVFERRCAAKLTSVLDVWNKGWQRSAANGGEVVWTEHEKPHAIATKIRKRCPALLDDVGYRSGLLQLRNLIRKNKDTWPPVVWKDSPPQHFRTTSGLYEWYLGAPANAAGCAAIGNATTAYARNVIADEILGDDVAFARTFAQDVDKWRFHKTHETTIDCTHFCNPSQVTWGWCAAVLDTARHAIEQLKN